MIILLTIFFAITTIISIYYLLRFARIIFVVEDNLSDSVESLERCLKTFEKILNMKLFFDSAEVRPILEEAINDIKTSKLIVAGIVKKFTAQSKQKYVRVEEEVDEDIE